MVSCLDDDTRYRHVRSVRDHDLLVLDTEIGETKEDCVGATVHGYCVGRAGISGYTLLKVFCDFVYSFGHRPKVKMFFGFNKIILSITNICPDSLAFFLWWLFRDQLGIVVGSVGIFSYCFYLFEIFGFIPFLFYKRLSSR